ncbi:hypothetical protein O6H91_15G045100 [Diphasiastrum complanatum]|uniref:Uncharacterized protein n=1 Tax=Diphasiastrum complanatum TaxID=34168 RepID=A0ACC2BIS4_DIPCM|nr:hypothetical protein O6H91_15G045100 [Diphasiastrum complanatum]
MLAWLSKMVFTCCEPFGRYVQMSTTVSSCPDPMLWYKDLVPHAFGDFSIAVVQANSRMEDQSQVETGPYGTFVGIYDGHGGPDAARFVNDHLFKYVEELVVEQGRMSTDVLRKAFKATERSFCDLVDSLWHTMPQIVAVGSCCLAGMISGQNLYIANAGDSRVILGTLGRTGSIIAHQLSEEHNANVADVRRELKDLHPDDSHIVMLKHGAWRVKGIIQVSRSIGDVYLKRPELYEEHSLSWLPLQEPLKRPVLTAEPSIAVHTLQAQDKFLIFASDGLWESLTNQEAVEIVHKYPRMEAAKKREMRYSDLTRLERGIRRHFHDDISVVVLYVDADLINKGVSPSFIPVSVKGGVNQLERPHQSIAFDAANSDH